MIYLHSPLDIVDGTVSARERLAMNSATDGIL